MAWNVTNKMSTPSEKDYNTNTAVDVLDKIRVAKCCCGQFSLTLKGDPLRVSCCHCFACQQRTGSVMGVQARFRAEQLVERRGARHIYTRRGDSGEHEISFQFCPHCASTLAWTFAGCENDFLVVAVGALCDLSIGEPVLSVYNNRRHPWVRLPEKCELFDD